VHLPREGYGDRCDRRSCDRVHQEVVAGRDDHEHDERRIEKTEHAKRAAPAVTHETRADDHGVADVHTRHRGERVVEGRDQAVIQVDMPAGDGVCDPERGGARRRCREREVPDQRERACEQQCRSDEGERVGPATVEPEQVHAGDRQVQCQVEQSERPDQSGKRTGRALNMPLDEDVQGALERGDVVRVSKRRCAISRDQAACRLVQGIEREDAGRLHDERMPLGNPGERRTDPQRRHAASQSRSSGASNSSVS
jgi:hypothetical protein